MKVPLLAEVPDPQAVDWYWSLPVRNWAAQQEVSGGQVNERGFICTYSRSPSLSHHPQMGQSHSRKTSSGCPQSLYYSELYNYFIIYHNIIITEIKSTINVIPLNHPEITPSTTSLENLSSRKPVPSAKKSWTLLIQRIASLFLYLCISLKTGSQI